MNIIGIDGHKMDLFCLFLLYYKRHNYLPDIYGILGEETTKELITTFAGATIKFPNEKELREAAFNVIIYFRLKSLNKKKRGKVAQNLGNEYGMTKQQILKIYNDVAKIAESKLIMGVNFGRGH